VCGSPHHPRIAAATQETPTREALDQARSLFEEANRRAQADSVAAGERKGQLEALETALQQLLDVHMDGIAIQDSPMPIKEAADEVERELAARIAAIAQEDRRIAEREALDRSLPQAEQALTALQERLTALRGRIATGEALAEGLTRQRQELRGQLAFDSRAAAEEQLQSLAKRRRRAAEALEEAREALSACDREIAALDGTILPLSQQLEQAEEIDLGAERQQRQTLAAERLQLREAEQRLHTRLETNRLALEGVTKQAGELEALDRQLTLVGALSATANGRVSGKERIMLETYIQMTWFDRILERANLRFSTMTGGQYQLQRRQEAGAGRSQSGLELDVIDYYNGTTRPVSSLSGGEAFKASLSLALGLADEVQASAGGIVLDTMFIDEGFGTLDDESRRQAIETLSGLAEGDRLVGIISHVAELKEQIERQIVVRKARSGGSRAEIV
ncbi:MAG: SMC family ATPase, partial [Clostridia bacterium]|nr:SMC family ATPase [Clostridia bacterium]